MALLVSMAAFAYLGVFNSNDVPFSLGGESMSVPLVILLMAAFGLGIGAMLAFEFMVETYSLISRKGTKRTPKSRRKSTMFLSKGEDAMSMGEMNLAKKHLTKALQADQRNPLALLALAKYSQETNDVDEAIRYTNRALAIHGEDIAVLGEVASLYEQAGNIGGAIDALKRALDIEDIINPKLLKRLIELYILDEKWGQALDAQEGYLKTVRKEPVYPGEKRRLNGISYEHAGDLARAGEVDQARKILTRIVKEEPEFLPASVSLGELLASDGDQSGAAKVWKKAYVLTPKIVLLERLENMYLSNNNPTEILNIYRASVEDNPNDLVLRLFYAKLCYRLEMIDESITQLKRVENAGGEFTLLYLLLGEIYYKRTDMAEAVEAFRKASGTISVPYVCTHCNTEQPDWSAQCNECRRWDTLITLSRAQDKPREPLLLPPPARTP